jgi:hypothetical protein
MKVRELIELLKAEDPEREVIMSKDSEGNGFSPFADLSRQSYEATTTWYGEIGIEELTPELREQGFTEEDAIYDEKVIVLWPIN